MLNDVDGALRTMTAPQELGVRLNMDDFGTGYSSLGYLRTYPLRQHQDRQALRRQHGEDRARPFDRAGHHQSRQRPEPAGHRRGVETEGQMHILRDEQCHELRFLLSRPLDAHGLRDLLAREAADPGATGFRRGPCCAPPLSGGRRDHAEPQRPLGSANALRMVQRMLN